MILRIAEGEEFARGYVEINARVFFAEVDRGRSGEEPVVEIGACTGIRVG